MRTYPWSESKEAIAQFLKTNQNWVLSLPMDLPPQKLELLYKQHRPKEFIAYDLLSNIFDHSNCPIAVLEEALDVFCELHAQVESCLMALSLRSELSSRHLCQLSEQFLGHDIGDHAIGALLRKNPKRQGTQAKKILKKLHDALPRPRERELKRYLAQQLLQGVKPRKE